MEINVNFAFVGVRKIGEGSTNTRTNFDLFLAEKQFFRSPDFWLRKTALLSYVYTRLHLPGALRDWRVKRYRVVRSRKLIREKKFE